jgi:hypothetical protein
MRGLLAALSVLCLGVLLSAKDAGKAPAPATLELPDGQKVPIVRVLDLKADPKAYKGVYAIEGEMGEAQPDKGRFNLQAYGEGVCTAEGCEDCKESERIYVSYDYSKSTGKLPATAQRVYVVAQVTPTAKGGFTLELREVRAGEKTLLSIKS